jgi:Peptidase family M23
MAIEEISVEQNAFGEHARYQRRMAQGLVGDHPGTVRKQANQPVGQPVGKLGRDMEVAASDVSMGQRRFARQALQRARQRIAKIAQQQMARIRPVVGMGSYLPIEDEDLAARQQFAQMIVGPAIAKAKLEHRPRQIRHRGHCEPEASALRLEPAYEAVETAHAGSFQQSPEDCPGPSRGQHRIGHMTVARCMMVMVWAMLLAGAAHATGTGVELTGALVQGGLVRGRVAPDTAVSLEGRVLRVTDDGWFVFGLGRDAPASLELLVTTPSGEEQRHSLAIAPRSYQVQRIDGLPPRTVTPSETDLAKIRVDAALLDAARRRDTAESGFAEQMAWPTTGKISGVYGSQRILNGEQRSPHRGVDIAAPKGTPVGAMARGEVALAETDMYFTGGTVMVDHGYGVHSIYVHLDEVRVTVGQRLRQGQTLGTVGQTGRATGPHLHWGVYWFDQAIDPALLVGAMPDGDQKP